MILITIDARKLNDILDAVGKNINVNTDAVIQQQLSWRSNNIAKELNYYAPSQQRTDDKRYDTKLKGSFYVERSGTDRVVKTKEPTKLFFVSSNTRPHDIPPRTKKALFWPGLSHPISYVGPPYTAQHPGQRANLFVEDVLNGYNLIEDAQVIADRIAVGTFDDRLSRMSE